MSNSITGTALFYAGGGAGGTREGNTPGLGGSGVGGNGARYTDTYATSGMANRGGGGGGASCNVYAAAGNGGSGVVIVRYQYQ